MTKTRVIAALIMAPVAIAAILLLPTQWLAAAAAAVFLIAYALAGRRERGFGRIAALLIPLELAADTVFTTGQHVCYGRAGGPVAGPLRSVGFDVLCGDGTGVHAGVTAPLTRVTGAETDRMASVLAQADPGTAWLGSGRGKSHWMKSCTASSRASSKASTSARRRHTSARRVAGHITESMP